MPKLNDPTVDAIKINGTSFTYSATGLQHLTSTEYTLATIAVDVSGSVRGFKNELEQAIKTIVQACKSSPRADNLLMRVMSFGNEISEVHGFKLLENCNASDYDGCLEVGGNTPLYEATLNAVVTTEDRGKTLYDQDIDVNAILFVVTDGCDYGSNCSIADVKNAIQTSVMNENLESFQTVLIGVNTSDGYVKDKLESFQKQSNISSYENIENASPASLAKLAEWVSKSIVVQSQSLGSGSGSKPVSLII